MGDIVTDRTSFTDLWAIRGDTIDVLDISEYPSPGYIEAYAQTNGLWNKYIAVHNLQYSHTFYVDGHQNVATLRAAPPTQYTPGVVVDGELIPALYATAPDNLVDGGAAETRQLGTISANRPMTWAVSDTTPGSAIIALTPLNPDPEGRASRATVSISGVLDVGSQDTYAATISGVDAGNLAIADYDYTLTLFHLPFPAHHSVAFPTAVSPAVLIQTAEGINFAYNAVAGDTGSLNGDPYTVHTDKGTIDAGIAASALLFGIEDLSGLFEGTDFVDGSPDISHWNVSTVTNMSRLFKNSNFNGDLDGWSVGSVLNFSSMFEGNATYNQVSSSWDMSAAENLSFMFKNAEAFNSALVWDDVQQVTDFSSMFEGATLFNQDITAWSTVSAVNMSSMFKLAIAFDQDINYVGAGEKWNTTLVTDMASMFEGGSFNQDISSWVTSSVQNFSSMFEGNATYNQASSSWDMSAAVNLSSMFKTATAFNSALAWDDVQQVTDFSSMFEGASLFNQDITAWSTRAALNMSNMFKLAAAFNQGINYVASGRKWDTTLVTDMASMFEGASDFNQDISLWEPIAATDLSGMFKQTNFDGTLDAWDVSNVQNMSGMFEENGTFNNAGAGWTGWATRLTNVTDFSNMFKGATSFVADISSWRPTVALTMEGMFMGASSFNQNLGGWDVTTVLIFTSMFDGATPFNQDLSSWIVDNATNMDNMFKDTSMEQDLSGWCVARIASEPTGWFLNGGAAFQPAWGITC